VISSAATTIDLHIAAIGPAQLLQPLHEGVHATLRFRIVCREIHEHANGGASFRAAAPAPRVARPPLRRRVAI